MNDTKKTKSQLIEELQLLRKHAAAPPPSAGGAWVVDLDFVVRVVNEQMCRSLGKSAEELIGKKCYDVFAGSDCLANSCLLRQAFVNPGPVFKDMTRPAIGCLPASCRVIAHLIQDRESQHAGLLAVFEDPDEASLPHSLRRGIPSMDAGGKVGERPQLPSLNATQLAETAMHVARSLRRQLPENSPAHRHVEALENACAPWNPRKPRAPKPELLEVPPSQSVLIAAPERSSVRKQWSAMVRRAGYTPVPVSQQASDYPSNPSAAILDLTLGEPETDALHGYLRKQHPTLPILVVSSSNARALEARRWKQAHTWYVPRSVAVDELARLIDHLSPGSVVRSRAER